MLVSALVDRYLAYQAKHNKPATERYYMQGLRWLRRDFGALEWSDLKRDEVIAGLDKANTRPNGKPWKNDTIRRNLTAIEQLQRYGIDQFDLDVILRPKDLKKPPGNRREAIPTDDELISLMQAAKEKGPALDLAFRALAASGMRPNELVKSTIANLSEAKDLIVLKDHKTAGKTGKARRIPLGDTLRPLVLEAMGERTEGPIWLDERGKKWTEQKLSRLFRLIKTRLGLNPTLVLYCLRHWKGTQVAKRHGILAASKVLGHTQISTTQRYAHPDDEDTKRWQE